VKIINRVKLKMEQVRLNSEDLFRKKMKLCLTRLVNQKPNEKRCGKIGRKIYWKVYYQSKRSPLRKVKMGMKMEIFIKRVKLKRNGLRGMHRKTRWKGFIINNRDLLERFVTIGMGAEVCLLNDQRNGNMKEIVIAEKVFENKEI
jgi:hypothetical protein